MTIFVPGVFGDGAWYAGLRSELASNGGQVQVSTWGAPKPLFVLNFKSRRVHERAETALAAKIDALPAEVRVVNLVGHSAGCGVVLGALAKSNRKVDDVVLIAPSVSPRYPLGPSLQKVTGDLHVFASDRDTLFLRWRTGRFGTYDGVRTPAAGFGGFAPTQADRVTQHHYKEDWELLGNEGGHMGGVARQFVRAQVLPLLGQHDQPR